MEIQVKVNKRAELIATFLQPTFLQPSSEAVYIAYIATQLGHNNANTLNLYIQTAMKNQKTAFKDG